MWPPPCSKEGTTALTAAVLCCWQGGLTRVGVSHVGWCSGLHRSGVVLRTAAQVRCTHRMVVGTSWWWLWAVLRGLLSDSSAACVLEQTASFVALDPVLFQWLALPRCSPTCRTFFSECTDSRVRRAKGKQGAMCTFTCCLASQGCGAVLRCHTCTLRP
jgi:hypothetical protein